MPKKTTKPAETATETKPEETTSEVKSESQTDCGYADRERTLRESRTLNEAKVEEVKAELKISEDIRTQQETQIVHLSEQANAAGRAYAEIVVQKEELQAVIAGLRNELSDESLKTLDGFHEINRLRGEIDKLQEALGSLDHAEAPTGRLLGEGTHLQMGEIEVVLASAAIVNYPGEESEQKFVGMLLQHPENFDANKHSLRFLYNRTNGTLLEAREQKPESMKNLTDSEKLAFGIQPDPADSE